MSTRRKQETVLVTGASGTVGREVVKQFPSAPLNVNIKAAVHSVQNAKKVSQYERVQTVKIDYNNPESLKAALHDVDKIFLVTPEVPNAPELVSNLVTEAKKSGIRYIVKLSAMDADLKADVASLRLHRQAENIIEESGIPYTFLRPGEFMQNFINWDSPMIKEQGVFWRVGDTEVSLVDVRDIATVAVKVLTDNDNNGNNRHNGKIYTITGPEALSYSQMAEILSSVIGRKISYVNISEEEARRAMKDIGLSEWWIKAIIEVYEYYNKGIQKQVSSAVEQVTGKKPISFSRFAKDYADAFR
jgi:uncharacterized protein YbjT (DUF2867 family)